MYPDGEGPGCIEINEATFLGIKQQGYTFEKDNKLIDKSVFAGIPRDSLTYEQIVELSEGKTLESTSKLRFYKSFSSLNIKIKEITPKKISLFFFLKHKKLWIVIIMIFFYLISFLD